MINQNSKYCAGFTLVELLVTLVLTMLVIAPMYNIYENSNKNYVIQNEVTEAENNLRAALSLLSYDLKTAGYDPTGSSGAGILSADATSITFTSDEDGDGAIGTGEKITYLFNAAHGDLLRRVDDVDAGDDDVVAENIQALEFYYDDSDASIDPSTTPVADGIALASIRTITVSLLVVTQHADQNFGSQSFTTASGTSWTTPAGHRGKFKILSVYCRNMCL